MTFVAKMEKLSIVIITKNEEKNIRRCLESVSWADEIVVVDSGSWDGTIDICKDYNCKVIRTDWLGFGKTKQLAVNSASHNWVLSIDADEEVTVELENEIKKVLSSDKNENGYHIKRCSFYLGKMIRYCGWNTDFPLRLFNKEHGNFNDSILHESVSVHGTVERITASLRHYTYTSITSHIERINRYTSLGAKQDFEKGKRTSPLGAAFRGLFKFLKMYILQRGFLDGREGFVLSVISGYGVGLKYFKLWELARRK